MNKAKPERSPCSADLCSQERATILDMEPLAHPVSRTVCNPIPLPDYPRGRTSIGAKAGDFGWLHDEVHDFRETADPSVLYHDGKWYLYPSCGMAWESKDFQTWTHHRIEPYDAGYAPTIVKHGDRFLLTACEAGIFSAPTPLGPFTPLGKLCRADGTPVAGFNDPMLFSDDDGRLYAYWGLGEPGLFAAEVDAQSCNHLISEPRMVFHFDPAVSWERYGEYNEDRTRSYVEGAWMVKAGGTYYLTYAAPGTEWRTYGMGAARGTSPLGPFTRQQRTPFCSRTEGLIQGPGHGCVVRGPRDTLWAFYTCRVCYEHLFERRIGFDPCGIDEHGELAVAVSEFPQWAPGVLARPDLGNLAGLAPMNHRRRAVVSGSAPGRPGCYAVDNCMHTWWEPASGDAKPTLEQDFGNDVALSAVRVVWRDVGLDYAAGRVPGPYRWRLETALADGAWMTVVDATANATDLLIDYRTFAEQTARRIRLTITGWPAGLVPGLTDLAVFGRT